MPVVGGNICYMPPSKGDLQFLAMPNPADVTAIAYTIPTNRCFFWVSQYCGAMCDATVVNRYFRLHIQTDTGRTIWRYKYGIAQLASESRAYALNRTNGNLNNFHFSSVHSGPLPEMWLLPGTVITWDMEGWVGTDRLYGCHQTFAVFNMN